MKKKQGSFSSRGAYCISVRGKIPDDLIDRMSAIHASAALLGVKKSEADISSTNSSDSGQKQEPDAE